jgi:hypothetical protein
MKKLVQVLISFLLVMTMIIFYITPAMADHYGLKHAKGSDAMNWDEECLEYITITKPKSEKHKVAVKAIKELAMAQNVDESTWNSFMQFHHATYNYMKRCNIKTVDIMQKSMETQQGMLCLIGLVKSSGFNEEFVGKNLATMVMKYEMCSQSPKEDRFKPISGDDKSWIHPVAYGFIFNSELYKKSILNSQSTRTIKKGEFEGETTVDKSGPKDDFDAYEKSTSGAKLTCHYSTNKGSETHKWTYSDKLYMDGQKVTDLGWSVKKKGGKKIFIVKGMAQLVIPIEFFIDFENSSSVETAAGVRIDGQCF